MARVSAVASGVMIWIDSTCGAAVAPQSLSSSPIATWNSSSRTPRGSSRWASNLPAASACLRSVLSAMNVSHGDTTTRRAVGTAVRIMCIASYQVASGRFVSITNSATVPPTASRSLVRCFASMALPVTMRSYSCS